MKIEVAYIYPAHSGEGYVSFAFRYLTSYQQFPAGIEHENVIVCTGGVTDDMPGLFKSLPNTRLLVCDNSGFDCGGYQAAAAQSSADLMVFFGVSTLIKGPGWLKRMAEVAQKHGSGLYGVMGNMGDARFNVYPHIRTTGFWMAPSLMNRYPHRVTDPSQRYAFEHGMNSLTQWVRNQYLKCMVCTWDGEYDYPNWDSFPNGIHRGDQSALIVSDRYCDPPYYGSNLITSQASAFISAGGNPV
jgi:hypothetical protein